MKLKMAPNSVFAVLLRSPWWASAGVAAAIALLASALLPASWRAVGVLSGFPFVVIAVLAAWRQRNKPSASRVAQTAQALAAMPWPQFAGLLEQAFRRDGHAVQRLSGGPADFELERRGRTMLVCARRWKSARTGLEPLRALQAAREAADAPDALFIGLGEPSDNARAFAAAQGIAVWRAAELAQALRGLSLPARR